MKVVIAPDSFKGSLPAHEVADALAAGVRMAHPTTEIDLVPIADGGEGTVDCLVTAVGGEKISVQVHDPIGRPINAHYGILQNGTVVVEVAAAAGLGLLKEEERDVLQANTIGVGEVIANALDSGATSILVGLGGSATNDAGMGMLHALGVRFYDAAGHELPPTPESGLRLAHVDVRGIHPKLKEARIRVACDVTNPLCGPFGATAVYGPQKGVTEELIPVLDSALEQFASVVEKDLQISIATIPGAGAAGGLGAALVGLLDAELVQGIDLILNECSFDAVLANADFVLTGEGKTDGQTVQGKAVQGVAMRANQRNVPVFCVSGAISADASQLYQYGVSALFSITHGPVSLEESMSSAREYLVDTAANITRVYLAGQQGCL
ncbi:glycerate kinase [Alicyclobacillus ferrooxydans]|uniref:Glycerate kinase n=1 Tax=Alicyclobacillus ferrooxydans TaxID=471514 RepID=A0A0N8PN85_9BACL|nr:glycerate kinase [Alicyclobacillus ferrooxydans]KPV40821.1 hypothetical protein AN477_21195 [Alicyclobacillus ferrooxydans]